MAGDSSPAKLDLVDETWREIEDLVDEVARLSKSRLSTTHFYGELLSRTVRAMAAPGGAIWLYAAGRFDLQHQINVKVTSLLADEHAEQSHRELLQAVVRAGRPTAVAPRSGQQGEINNPTEFLAVLCPVVVDEEPMGVIEVFQHAEASPAAQKSYVRLMSVLGELACDFHRHQELRRLRNGQAQWDEIDRFAQRVHHSLDLEATCYVIANEGRRLIGCDRLSVAVRDGRRLRVRSVSGLDRIDPRSNAIRSLERLSAAVLKTGETLWYSGDSTNCPPQLEASLHGYVDDSHARTLAVMPLRPDGSQPASPEPALPLGALVVERFEADELDDVQRQRIATVCRHSAAALGNSIEFHSMPLLPLSRALRRTGWLVRGRRLPRTGAVVLAAVAVVAVLVFTPTEFAVRGRGELQPKIRRDIFAPADGVVHQLHAAHAEKVSAGDLLVELRRSELDYEFSRVLGEIQTTRRQLQAVQASRLSPARGDSASPVPFNQLTAEEERLKELLKSLESQQEILVRQRSELQVRSPIDGKVLTWNLDEMLHSRPVKRGQRLMTVANLDGPWTLEMRIADQDVGHVLAAAQRFDKPLRVSFMLATDPGRGHQGYVQQIGMSTETDGARRPSVWVNVNIDRQDFAGLRPGAGVTARVHCGRRSIGYVWFRDLMEAIRTRLLF